MPSHFIPSSRVKTIPPAHINLRKLHTFVHNRAYNSYFERLVYTGYEFPPVRYCQEDSGVGPETVLKFSAVEGDTFVPRAHHQWLVFVDIASTITVYVARYIVRVGEQVQLFGVGSNAVHFTVVDGTAISVIAVEDGVVEKFIRDPGVTVL